MRLSEAIRLGGMQWPQGFDGYMDRETRCALAGASDVAGIAGTRIRSSSDRVSVDYGAMLDRFPILGTKHLSGCACEHWNVTPEPLQDIIIHFNDRHQWTRERIADWVETIEPPEPVTVEEEPISETLADA